MWRINFVNILNSRKEDNIYIFLPFIIIFTIYIVLQIIFPWISFWVYDNNKTLLWFVFLVLMIFDVPHVWSSIYRTYSDRSAFKKHRKIYLSIPILSFISVFLLVLYDNTLSILFWLLALYAVYHFMKQQIWFIALYSYKEQLSDTKKINKDKTLWWLVTWIPILYWFANLETRNYNWFTDYEFFKIPSELFPMLFLFFWIYIIYYIVSEIKRYKEWWYINVYKYLYIIWTMIVWFYGIVITNSMILFALWNMILHWWNFFWIIFSTTKKRISKWLYKSNKIFNFITKRNILFFIFPLIIIWFIEQFGWFLSTGADYDNRIKIVNSIWLENLYLNIENINIFVYSFIISILTLPQLTHYILDWIIWKSWHLD